MRAPSPPSPIVHLHLDLTNHCNFRCEFCFHFGDLTARRGFMDTSLALRLIDEVADKGLASEVSSAVFGEALMHPDFFPIAAHAVERGLGFTLNTKGGLLDAETARRICATGIDKLIISLNTADEAGWKINHGPSKLTYEGHVERIRDTIDQKLALGSPIEIYLYVMNTHFARPRGIDIVTGDAQARQVVGFWRDLAAGLARRHRLEPPPETDALCGRGDLVKRKWPIDRGLKLLPGVELVFKEGHLWGNRIIDPDLVAVPTEKGFCPLPWMMLTVHWDGDCSLCCLDYNKEAVLGNARDTPLEEIFSGEKIRRIRSGFMAGRVDEPLCQKCLGGLKHRTTGEVVRRPQSSPLARIVNGVQKYGVYQSLQYGLGRLFERPTGDAPRD